MIKLVLALQSSSKARRENGLFVLEGLRICKDALENHMSFVSFLFSDSAAERFQKETSLFCENASACYRLPDSLFERIGDTKSPQGFCAVCAIPKSDSAEIDRKGRYVALENVADPANLGAVARTAEALGVSGLILSSGTCDPYSPKALRASMGTLLRLPLFVWNDFVKELSKSGLTGYACVADRSATPIDRVIFKDGCAVMIGNEANGLTEETKRAAAVNITIPMCGKTESLNAAAAAAIAMWEMMR